MADDTYTPDESWGDPQEAEPQSFTPDESWGEGKEIKPEGALASAVRGGAHEVIPSVVGGIAGLGVGAATQAAVPIPGSGIVGGLVAGGGAAYGTRKFQDWLLEQLGFDDSGQMAANRQAHPISTAAGELSTGLVPFGIGSKVAAGQRLLGAGIMSGVEAGSELAQSGGDVGSLDPVQIALSGGMGALANQPRKFTGSAAMKLPIGGKARASIDDMMNPGKQTQEPAAGEAITGEPAPEGDTDLSKVSLEQQEVMKQIDLYKDDPVLGPYWKEYYERMGAHQDKGDPSITQEASQGKGEEFTPAHADAANDATTVAVGVAHENPKPPQNEATGNPTGAPMQNRVGARPADPARDYRKESATPQGEVTAPVTTGQVAPDVLAVLHNDTAQTTMDQSTVQPPNPPKPIAAPTPPGQQGPSVAKAMAYPLKRLGYTDADIATMDTKEAASILRDKRPKGAVPLEESPLPSTEGEEPLPPTPEGYQKPLHPVEQVSQQVSRMDPVEASQLQRDAQQRALAAVRARNEGQQKGEAFEGLTPAASDLIKRAKGSRNERVVVPEKPQAPVETGIPTVEAKPARKGLDEYGPDDLARVLKENPAAFKKFLDEDPQGVREVFGRDKALMDKVIEDHPALADILKPMKKSIREKEKYDAGNKRLGERGKKYEEVSKSVKGAVDEATPHWIAQDEEGEYNPEAVKGLAERVMTTITQGRDGYNPFKGKDGYRPQKLDTEDTMHFGVALAARDVLAKPSEENINTFDSWMRAYTNKDLEAAKALQAERKAAADIALQSETVPLEEGRVTEQGTAWRPTDAGREVAGLADEGGREPFPLLERGKKVLAHNELRDYVNGLSDEDYSKLLKYDDELERTVLGTKQPENVLAAYRRELAAQEPPKRGRIFRPEDAEFDAVAAEERKGISTKIENAADLEKVTGAVTEPEARKLGTSEPEQDHVTLTPEPDEAAATSKIMAMLGDETGGGPVPPALQRFAENSRKPKSFMKDTSGAVQLPGWMTNAANRMWTAASRANPVLNSLADSLRERFNLLDGRFTNVQMDMYNHIQMAPEMPNTFMRGLTNAYESKTPFTPEQQQYWDRWVQPLMDRYNRTMNAWRAVDPDIPPQFAGVEANHLPRVLMDALVKKKFNDAPWLRSLNDWNPATQDRSYFNLTDGAGQKMLVERADNGDWHTIGPQGGHGTNFTASLPNGWKGHPGEQVTLNGTVFTLDHATTSDINAAIPTLTYVKNPLISLSNAIVNAEGGLMKNRLLEQMKADPAFMAAAATTKEDALARGYKLYPTRLEDFAKVNGKDAYWPDSLRWIMDDFAKPGFAFEGLNRLSNFAQLAARPMYFLNPAFHVLNVADNYLHALGGVALKGKIPVNAKEAYDAWKSVYTQDQWQQRMRAAGGRSMFTSVLLDGGLMNKAAQKFAIDLPKQEGFWTPITKATGMDVPAIGRLMMNKANGLTWFGNDLLQTALFMRHANTGMSDPDAVKAVERFIGAYRPDSSTMFGMRFLQQFMNTPAFSWFGYYHQDLWRSLGHTITGLLPSASPQLRREALGTMLVSAMVLYGMYPLLDEAAKKVTGNDHAEFGRRGISQIQSAAYHGLYKGDKDLTELARHIWTPSIPANMFIEGIKNKDFTGNPIWQPGMSTGQNAARAADWAAKQAIPPYSMAASSFQPGKGPGEYLKKLAESQVGIKDPSARAIKYENNAPKRARQAERRGARRPGGLFEYLYTR